MELPLITVFTGDRMSTLWQNIFAIMFLIMPILVTVLAIKFGGKLLTVIRNVANPNQRDEERFDIKIKD